MSERELEPKAINILLMPSVLPTAYGVVLREVIQHHLNAPSCVCSENGKSVHRRESCFYLLRTLKGIFC